MDLNLLPEETEEEEALQEQIEEEIEAATASEDVVEDAAAEEEDAGEEEDAEEYPENGSRAESSVEILRREREERRAKMKRKWDSGPNDRMTKALRASNSASQPSASAQPLPPPPPLPSSIPLIPKGWIDCPAFGKPVFRFIPSKVPLAEDFNAAIEPGKRYGWKRVQRQQKEVASVIDLTNTSRYYSAVEITRLGLNHMKIPCKGRNAVPDPLAVNTFVYEANRILGRLKNNACILVHCTHGFNRTGYMIVNFLIRYRNYSVTRALEEFAAARPPGIYKKSYIRSLYTLYHDPSRSFVAPEVPDWKRLDLNGAIDDEDIDEDDDGEGADDKGATEPMTSDDVLGDAISHEEQVELQWMIMSLLELPRTNMSFPGSHPVSLERSLLQLLRQKYYFATWKADGTRYMMLILFQGCYLIDRKFNFRRVQMRFPRRDLQGLHSVTLLDGEMVIDKLPDGLLSRRYLIYDLMILNSVKMFQRPFSERFSRIESDVIQPRKYEQAKEQARPEQTASYSYQLEVFNVRRKNFWPLSTTKDLLDLIHNKLTHGADGLIFQGFDDLYVCRTHYGLLKWKFASMNSVDFKLQRNPDNSYSLLLGDKRNDRVLEGATVTFPPNVDPVPLENKIIECCWNQETQVWEYMRQRVDKDHANAFNTYLKVMNSIQDNITQDQLLEEISNIVKLPMYQDRDRKFKELQKVEQKKQKQPQQRNQPRSVHG